MINYDKKYYLYVKTHYYNSENTNKHDKIQLINKNNHIKILETQLSTLKKERQLSRSFK